MDRFTAHMDRSWDLITKGETTGALVAARQALDLNAEAPEVHNLLGYIHALEGDFEEALDYYRQAIELDEAYLEPILNAAELLVHPDADPEEAIRLCRLASELALGPDEDADVALIEVDALLNLGQDAAARQRLAGLEDTDKLPAAYQIALGRALFDAGEAERAREFVARALENDDSSPDAWYCLGLIEREDGQRIAAVQAFLATRERDLLLPRLPWAQSIEQLEARVTRIRDELPGDVGAALRPARVIVDDYPTVEQIRAEVDPRQVVLVEGIDPQRGCFERLRIFALNLERMVSPLLLDDEIGRLIVAETTGGDKRLVEFDRAGR